ncbi:hypothetical protein PENTCL1PPCAC_15120, partial [Pristionchus entomophagus]
HHILAHSEVSHDRYGCSSIIPPGITVGVDYSCIGRKGKRFLNDFVIRSSHKIITFIHERLLDNLKIGDLHERN